MEAITTDKNGEPIGIGTVVEIDETVSVPKKIGTVAEVTFAKDNVNLKIPGVRGTVSNEHVTVTDFNEFETLLYNVLAEHKAYLTHDEIRELSKKITFALFPVEDNSQESD